MAVISVSVPEKLLERVEKSIKELGFANKSEIIRQALRTFIRESKNLRELESARRQQGQQRGDVSDNKLQYEKKKQLDRDIRKVKGLIQRSEDKISDLEKRIEETNERLINPAEGADFDSLSRELGRLNADLEKEMEHWEKHHADLDQLKRDSETLQND